MSGYFVACTRTNIILGCLAFSTVVYKPIFVESLLSFSHIARDVRNRPAIPVPNIDICASSKKHTSDLAVSVFQSSK